MIKSFIKFIVLGLFIIFISSCSTSGSNSELDNEISSLEESTNGETADEFEDESGEDDFFADEETPEDKEKIAQSDESEDENLDETDSASEGDEAFEQEQVAEEEQEPEPQQELEPEPEKVVEEKIVEPVVEAEPIKVTNIKFLDNQSGGTVVIETSGEAQYTTRINAKTNQYVVEIANATLPESLKRPYILKEFKNASFSGINAYQNAGGKTARIVVQLKSGESPMIQKEGKSLLILPSTLTGELASATKPLTKELTEDEFAVAGRAGTYDVKVNSTSGGTAEATYDYKDSENSQVEALHARSLEEFIINNNKFYGKPISIQVKDASVRDVLNFIAEESGSNIVISDDVTGNISVKLRKVPWDQALVIILRSKNLGYVRHGSVLRVSSLKVLKSESDQAKAVWEAKKELLPLRVQIVPVSYASVKTLSEKVKPFLSDKRGKVVADERTSTLLVTDTDDVIEKVTNLVKELDVPPPQVLMEGKIIEATETFTENFGINWRASGSSATISESGGLNGGPISIKPDISITPTLSGGTGSFGLNIGTLDVFGNISATLALAEGRNLARVISAPRVITMNNKAANISQTLQSPYTTSVVGPTGVPMTQVQFQDFKLDMKVTPQITNDSSVIMNIDVVRSTPSGSAGSSGASAKNESSAKTQILVKNGQTAVVGGIYSGSKTSGESRVPGFANIPVLGWLFKSKSEEKNKNELMIFITPRIINAEGISQANQLANKSKEEESKADEGISATAEQKDLDGGIEDELEESESFIDDSEQL